MKKTIILLATTVIILTMLSCKSLNTFSNENILKNIKSAILNTQKIYQRNVKKIFYIVNPNQDRDSDGFIDAVEIAAGSNPEDASNTPISIPKVLADDSLTLWLDANNILGTSTVNKSNVGIDNGASISIWKDLSGNDNDARAGLLSSDNNSSYEPILTKASQNNKDVITFNGAKQFQIADNLSLRVGSSDYSIFIVFKKNTGFDPLYLLTKGFAGGSGTLYKRYSLYAYSNKFKHEIDDDTYYKGEWAYNNYNKFKILYTERNSIFDENINTTALNTYIDKGGKTPDASIDISHYGNLDESPPQAMTIGGRTWGKSTSYCDFAEIIMFKKAMTVSERKEMFDYLTKKMGLKGKYRQRR
ncbi:hypothetical protein DID75_02975 [Candidatus Marinamargulisbacteria bacterium SCGC AG-410-N11]|nr:hypothetical protein DID75_02975 [Candidatus Marinamargulisbacteria bacterium SCGC AG-410-N11]